MSGRVDVAVLGATGVVGEQLLAMLADHSLFRLAEVGASAASAGKRLGDIADVARPEGALRLVEPGAELNSPVVLSALPSTAATELEPHYAARGHVVCSNAAAHRDDPRVPLLVPEVNPQSVRMVNRQPWRGALVTNPNCVVSGLVLALAPLHARFGIEALTVVTLQALSGAGRDGPSAWQMNGNVVPHIAGEADKIPTELRKLLDAHFPTSARVHRVPVLDGHMATVFVRLGGGPDVAEVRETFQGFIAPPAARALPSAPARPIHLLESAGRPQPRLDLDVGDGMAAVVGGLQRDRVHGVAFTVLSHNLRRGAAGACLLNAELVWQEQQGV